MEYELYHHGILGMKWGIRRYQNEDGSLTPAGKKRLADKQFTVSKTINKMKTANSLKEQKRLQKKAFRQIDRYTYLINRLSYNKMTDDQIINLIRNTRFNDPIPTLVTTKNVDKGQSVLSGKTGYFNDLGTIGTGVKNAAAGAVGVVGLISAIRKLRSSKNS